jgi:O-antigen/teichoic acid export membrane protein
MTIGRIEVNGSMPPDRRHATRLDRVLAFALSRTDVIVSVADQFMVSAANFAIGILAARALGVAEFGRFAVILIIATLMQAFHNVILSMPMMTLAGQRSRRSAGYFSAVMAWNVVLSTIAGILAALIVIAMYGARDGALPWPLIGAAAVYTVANNLHYVLRRVLFVQNLGLRAFTLDAVRYACVGVGIIGVARLASPSAEGVLWVLGAAAFISFVAFAPFLPRGRISMRLMRAVIARHWPFARWLLPMTGLTLLHEQAIFVGVGVMLGDPAVGALRSGQYLLGVTHFLTMAMENFVPTGAARAFTAGGRVQLRHYLFRQMVLFGAIIGTLILLIAVFAQWWLTTAFGPAYTEFAPVLRVYAVSYCCIFVRDVWTHYFRAIERTDIILKAFAWSFVACLVLFYPALTVFGVVGAALIVLVAHAVSMIYLLLRVRNDIPATESIP